MPPCDGKKTIPEKMVKEKRLGYTDNIIKELGLGSDCRGDASKEEFYSCVLLKRGGGESLTPHGYFLCLRCLKRYKKEKVLTSPSA